MTTETARQPELLEYALGPALRAFSTTRRGGVGEGAYAGFNITHYCGDSPEHVRANRRLLCEELGIDDARLLLPRQTHGDHVLTIDDAFLSLPAEAHAAALEGHDALITDRRGVCIGVSTADCVPVLLYAPGVVGAVHAGWRGTVKQVVRRAVEAMTATYGIAPADLRAVIGPCISADAFEVGDEVVAAFAATAAFPMADIARRYPSAGGAKWHIDLRAANVCTLEQAGLDLTGIMVADVCTYRDCERFFSARRLGIDSGRIFSGIMLR